MSPQLIATIRAAQEGLQLLRAARGGDQSGQRSIADHDSGHQSSSGQYGSGTAGFLVSGLDVVRRVAADAPGRFPRSQTHKASSAESIIAYCLKQRGWSGRWKDGKLTDRQRVRLLEDVRLYGRRWLRHEAEGVFGGPARSNDDIRAIEATREIRDGFPVQPQDAKLSSEGDTGLVLGEIFRASIAPAIYGGTASTIRRFFARAKQFVRELIHAGVMAIRGTPNLDQAEVVEADRAADIQERFFDGFERDVLGQNPPTPGRAAARVESYANSAWQSAQRINHAGHTGSNGRPPYKMRSGNPARWERLVMGHPKTEHCHECPPDAALGWVPIGTLRPIGDRECGHLCLCHFEYSDSLERPEMKPKKPKPEKPKTHKVTQYSELDALMADLREKLGKAGVKGLKVNVSVEVGVKK